MNPRASSVNYRSPYCLDVQFTSGEVRRFDLEPYLSYPVYEKLKDESYAAKASIKNGIVVWGDEVDIDPDRLYLESETLTPVNITEE